jgi:hypothetical protein
MPGFRGMDTVVYGCGADGAFGKKMPTARSARR